MRSARLDVLDSSEIRSVENQSGRERAYNLTAGRDQFGRFFIDERGFSLVWFGHLDVEVLGREILHSLPDALITPDHSRFYSRGRVDKASKARGSLGGKAYFALTSLKGASTGFETIEARISERRSSKFLGTLRRASEIQFARLDVEVSPGSRSARGGVFYFTIERTRGSCNSGLELAVRLPFGQGNMENLLEWAINRHSLKLFDRLDRSASALHLLSLIEKFREPPIRGGGSGGMLGPFVVRDGRTNSGVPARPWSAHAQRAEAVG